MINNPLKIFLSPFFIFSLFLLLLNDFFLKQQFHNFLTGKLSDFAGLFVFPLFFAAFFPKRKSAIYISTAIFFIFWKSPLSQSLIDFWNSVIYFKIWRVVDYTDLLALSVLPLSYFYFETQTQKQKTFSISFAKRAFASFIVLLSVFAFTATTLVKDRSISLEREYNINLDKGAIENTLRKNPKIQGLKFQSWAEKFPGDNNIENKDDFIVDFSLKQRFCDSEYPKFSFLMEQNGSMKIFGVTTYFECKLYEKESNSNTLTAQHRQELQSIFEREVIEKLRQNSSQ
jgi:uncharacterized protein YqcC (DUF446 family)